MSFLLRSRVCALPLVLFFSGFFFHPFPFLFMLFRSFFLFIPVFCLSLSSKPFILGLLPLFVSIFVLFAYLLVRRLPPCFFLLSSVLFLFFLVFRFCGAFRALPGFPCLSCPLYWFFILACSFSPRRLMLVVWVGRAQLRVSSKLSSLLVDLCLPSPFLSTYYKRLENLKLF